jgi:hypothetical protein
LGGGIDGDLALSENKSVGLDGLRVGADGLRSVIGRNDFAHKNDRTEKLEIKMQEHDLSCCDFTSAF